MNITENQTREKIIFSALTLFSERGIKKTSLEEVAYQAGVSRVTVYRYFANKRDLVLEAFLRVQQVFQKGLSDLKQNPLADLKSVLNEIGEGLNNLPSRNASERSYELKRLYPDIYNSIQEVRIATLNSIFEHFFAIAEHQRLLRPGLNRSIIEAIYWELVINFFDNPRFESFGLSGVELYYAMTDILLHGILKN
jgi:AcrR family transcriptional regulator